MRCALARMRDFLREVTLHCTRGLELILALAEGRDKGITLAREEFLQGGCFIPGRVQLRLKVGRTRLKRDPLALDLLTGASEGCLDLVTRIETSPPHLLARLMLRAGDGSLRLSQAALRLLPRLINGSLRVPLGFLDRCTGERVCRCPLTLGICSGNRLCGCTRAFGFGTLLRGEFFGPDPFGFGTFSLGPNSLGACSLGHRRSLRDRMGVGLCVKHAHDKSSNARDRSPRVIADAPDLRTRVDGAVGRARAHAT